MAEAVGRGGAGRGGAGLVDGRSQVSVIGDEHRFA